MRTLDEMVRLVSTGDGVAASYRSCRTLRIGTRSTPGRSRGSGRTTASTGSHPVTTRDRSGTLSSTSGRSPGPSQVLARRWQVRAGRRVILERDGALLAKRVNSRDVAVPW